MVAQPEDDFIIEAVQFELVPAGVYPVKVSKLETFMGSDFNTGEPKEQIRFVVEITEGDWAGETVDRIVSKTLGDERSILHQFLKGVTGITAVAGQQYPIKTLLLNKPAMAVIEHYTNKKNKTYARIASLAQPAQPRRRQPATETAPPTPAAVVEEPDDEFDET